MSVATEIAQHLHGAAEGGLGIDHPVVAMEATEQLCELLLVGESRSRRKKLQCAGPWRRFWGWVL